MRSLRTMLFGVLLVVLAACSGGPGSSSSAESTGGEPSTAATESAAAGTPAESTSGNVPASLEELEAALVPPHSTQISRTEVPQPPGVAIAYTSTDSVGDLKSYYVLKLADLGMTVIGTNEAANTWAVTFGVDRSGGGLGGTIAINNAGDVSNVLVTLADVTL